MRFGRVECLESNSSLRKLRDQTGSPGAAFVSVPRGK